MEERKVELQERKQKIKDNLKKAEGMSVGFTFAGIIFFVLGIGMIFLLSRYFDQNMSRLVGYATLIYSVIIFAIGFVTPKRVLSLDLQEVENELDLLDIHESSIEQRAEKLFKHHQLELKRYYDENLKQNSFLFAIGIICIFLGFAIIGITIYLLITQSSKQLESKLIIGSLGAIGAILSNFIAVLYLKMHSETLKSLTEFHNRLVFTHHLHFSNFLLSKIHNQDKREDALVQLAVSINKKNIEVTKSNDNE